MLAGGSSSHLVIPARSQSAPPTAWVDVDGKGVGVESGCVCVGGCGGPEDVPAG